jgi:hypothetical protein
MSEEILVGMVKEEGIGLVCCYCWLWRQALISTRGFGDSIITGQLCDYYGTPHYLSHVTEIAVCYGIKCWRSTYDMLRLV